MLLDLIVGSYNPFLETLISYISCCSKADGMSPGLLPHPSSFTNFDLPFPSSLLQSIEHLAIHVESKGKEKATVTEDVIAHDASQAKLSDAVAEGFATQSIEAQNDKTLWLGLECCHCYK
ncbi:predicted protein [Botrytis cinerea T4]|uniref:Uncharacterized protein n=1 Tax=Botryotinia fuckeliana (strain T4) TaxID=999810 RepID=G2YRK0_BOTF4|nr:predicted protein [Botrytis cinerea T4]